MGHGVFLTEILKQGREGSQLAAHRRIRKMAFLKGFTSGNDMGTGDRAKLFRLFDADKA